MAQRTTFASRIGDTSYTVDLTPGLFSDSTPAALYREEAGRNVWAVDAEVTLESASEVAIIEAKRLLGNKYGTEWTLRTAGRKVSGYNGKYFHHYHFDFRPKRGSENLQIIVRLDGALIPATQK